jgi:hypothetical protein
MKKITIKVDGITKQVESGFTIGDLKESMKIYTVYKREMELHSNGRSWFMGDVTRVVFKTRIKILAIVVAKLNHAKWIDGNLTAGTKLPKPSRPPLKLRLAAWRLGRAIKWMK